MKYHNKKTINNISLQSKIEALAFFLSIFRCVRFNIILIIGNIIVNESSRLISDSSMIIIDLCYLLSPLELILPLSER